MSRPKQKSSPHYKAQPHAIESAVQPRIASGDPTTTPSSYPVPKTMSAVHLGDDDEFWSIKTVSQKTGLSRASIYRYVARNLFPPRRRIGPGRIAWLGQR